MKKRKQFDTKEHRIANEEQAEILQKVKKDERIQERLEKQKKGKEMSLKGGASSKVPKWKA